MIIQVEIESNKEFIFHDFVESLGMPDITLAVEPSEMLDVWGFYVEGQSATLFTIEKQGRAYILSMDKLACYDDYLFWPYLVDTLCSYLTGVPFSVDGKSAFSLYNDEWIEGTIGDEIAYLKCMLKIGAKYYISLPIADSFCYVSEECLDDYGVTIYSSTPRIYGYVCYLLKRDLLPSDESMEEPDVDDDYVVDVPQHKSIGTVLSWQTDGTEATESYSREDVDILLSIAERYRRGEKFEGVVLNDIGTIFEYAIGVKRNATEAVYWFTEAMKNGDSLYAPTSLGDIYRRGLDEIKPDLSLALDAYRKSEDPYAWYRIGQSYEEGWEGTTDMQLAMKYYHKAADVGHHLALKRLECDDEY